MAQKVDCPCGETIRGETDDELVSNVEQHVQDDHPDRSGPCRASRSWGWPRPSDGEGRGGIRRAP